MRKKRTQKEELEFLEYLADHETKEVATHFGLSIFAVNSWIQRIRKKIVETQAYVNRIRTLQRISPRIRKLTTDGTVPEEEEETEQ